jgi:hypothetical protein
VNYFHQDAGRITFVAPSIAGVLAVAVFGCASKGRCFPPEHYVNCDSGGAAPTVAIDLPSDFAAPPALWATGQTCLAPDGSCTYAIAVSVQAIRDEKPGNYSLEITASVPAGHGPGTYTLAPDSDVPVRVAGQIDVGQTGVGTRPLTGLSGAMVIDLATPAELRVSRFDMRVETQDHQVFSVRGSDLVKTGCHVYTSPPYCIDEQ